jgi:hypothetical protein
MRASGTARRLLAWTVCSLGVVLFLARIAPAAFAASAWTVESTPAPLNSDGTALNGVSCSAPRACTAVGFYDAPSGASPPVAERWNGVDWAIQPVPNPPDASGEFLRAVSCPRARSCTAVGADGIGPSVSVWNGDRWASSAVPLPAGASGGFLFGVSCTAVNACTAVGEYSVPSQPPLSNTFTLAERWDGHRWRIQSTPNPTTGPSFVFNSLAGVSCASLRSCIAVGVSDQGALAERWDGSSWQAQQIPGQPAEGLNAVSCPARRSCTAVGETNAEHWDGVVWSSFPVSTTSGNELGSVSCPTTSVCTAVGLGGAGAGATFSLAERSDGRGFHQQLTPDPPGAIGNAALGGVSCTTVFDCTAVGSYFGAQGTGSVPFAEGYRLP